VHTCDWATDEALTSPGATFWVADVPTAQGTLRVGSMICADREFPESAQLLQRHGAELVLVPNACHLGTRKH
jgi:predicted amidohydrolase